jgi:lactate permease
MSWLPFFWVISPFILFLFLLFVRKVPLFWVTLITLIAVLLIATFYWQVYPSYIVGSVIKGFLVALDIFFIIFGAIFFLEILKQAKVTENVGYYLESVSKDMRIQVIFLAWFFENFLEGTAGFGTPATIVAPLLIGLGISPLNAVIITLLGNSSSVVFGAVGTPIKVGFAGLGGVNISYYASLINSVGIFVPAFILWFVTKNKQNGKTEFIEAFPFAIWSGIAFIVPSIFVTLLGHEFPSILGSVIGLVLVLLTTKLGWLIPKTEKEMKDNPHKITLSITKVFFPYLSLIVLLVLGKIILGSYGLEIPNQISHKITFYNPGFAFVIAGIMAIFVYKINWDYFGTSIKKSFSRSLEPFLVIAFMSILSQVMLASTHNLHTIPSMVDVLSIHVKNNFMPLWAPIVGSFGSFLTGSATISNLMFGNFFAASAKSFNFDVDKILALVVVGGAAGNMIALGDIITAEAVVGLKNKEKTVLKEVIIPCVIYVTLVGLLGLIFI